MSKNDAVPVSMIVNKPQIHSSRLCKYGLIIFVVCLKISTGMAADNGPVYVEGFIAAPGLFKSNHGSSILELKDGNLLSCWYAGSREKGRDVQIYCSSKKSADGVWQKPVTVVRRGERAEGQLLDNLTLGNTVLYLDHNNIIWLFYTAVTVGTGWSGSHVDYKTSKDNGKTWSKKGKRLFWYWGNLSRNKPIALDGRKILFPFYHELFQTWGFTCVLELVNEIAERKDCQFIPGIRHLQPSLISISEDEIFGYLRNKKRTNILLTRLNRKTGNWSDPVEIDLPNPNASVDTIKTEDGILMVYNHSSKNRNILRLAYSIDGIHFKPLWDFEKKKLGSFSYPSFIAGSDHIYHLSYSYSHKTGIKYISFNREWLRKRIKGVYGPSSTSPILY